MIRSNVTILGQSDPDSTGLQFNGGAPRVIGNVVNGSSVFLTTGNTTGTIEGDYAQQAGARLMITRRQCAAGHRQGHPRRWRARAWLRLRLRATERHRQDLIHADGGLSGAFSTPATSSGLQGLSLLQSSYGYDSNNAWLNLTQVSVTRRPGLGLPPRRQHSGWRVHLPRSTRMQDCRDRPSVR